MCRFHGNGTCCNAGAVLPCARHDRPLRFAGVVADRAPPNAGAEDVEVTTTTLQADPTPAVTTPDDQAQIKRLMIYFGVVYFVEGTGQTAGIIYQPISHYLKEVHAWTPVQVTAFLTVFPLPWVIKPLYGLVSDFV